MPEFIVVAYSPDEDATIKCDNVEAFITAYRILSKKYDQTKVQTFVIENPNQLLKRWWVTRECTRCNKIVDVSFTFGGHLVCNECQTQVDYFED